MSTNEHMCKYIDKDKILPWIDKQLDENPEPNEDALWIDQAATYAYRSALLTIKEQIEKGMFDWQQGSE